MNDLGVKAVFKYNMVITGTLDYVLFNSELSTCKQCCGYELMILLYTQDSSI